MRLICGNTMQNGKKSKKDVYDELKGEWDMHRNDLVMCFGGFNGDMARQSDGHNGVHGGNGDNQTWI